MRSPVPESIARLLTPEAVRERCHEVLAAAEAGAARHFEVVPAALDGVVDLVVAETRANYPDGRVPLHSRWRHFELGGRDLWAELLAAHPPFDAAEQARAGLDLAVVSVLLDAGAGPAWTYRDAATDMALGRSEGLALASLRLFGSGALSRHGAAAALRADAEALAGLTPAALAEAFQVTDENPLIGVAERAGLLNRLGAAILARPDVYARDADTRPGHLLDHLSGTAAGAPLPARAILVALLDTLGPIWPHGLSLGGVALGDVGRHPAVTRTDGTGGLVPFHKLSQWMSYSLIEPLQAAGLTVIDIDGLTGLAEYRNGGLLIDGGVLVPRHDAVLGGRHRPDSEVVVEWRALTVALLDRIAGLVRARLGQDATTLPLSAVLQGGTWAAGRRLARERRADGGPPLAIESDGTVF